MSAACSTSISSVCYIFATFVVRRGSPCTRNELPVAATVRVVKAKIAIAILSQRVTHAVDGWRGAGRLMDGLDHSALATA
jgi:hypothetical protein